MKKYALCLSGGGTRSAFQYGALQALRQLDIERFDLIFGISAGSMVGAVANNFFRMSDMFADIAGRPDRVFQPYFTDCKMNFKPFKAFLSVLKGRFNSLASIQPLKELLLKYGDLQNPDFFVGVVSLLDGKEYYLNCEEFETPEEFAYAVIASGVILPQFEPVRRLKTKTFGELEYLVDGGFRTVTPQNEAIVEMLNRQADDGNEWHLIIINARNESTFDSIEDFKRKNLYTFLKSGISIMLSQVFTDDKRRGFDHSRLKASENNYSFTIIEPDEDFYIPKNLNFEYGSMNRLRRHGFEKTIEIWQAQ